MKYFLNYKDWHCWDIPMGHYDHFSGTVHGKATLGGVEHPIL